MNIAVGIRPPILQLVRHIITRRGCCIKQCVELIKAYGFDGIDIDWEYPGYADHSGTPEDKVNDTLFLKAIREALDALEAETGKFYGLTAGKSFDIY